MDCTTCGKTEEQLKRRARTWECSHVECPRRRPQVSTENLTHIVSRDRIRHSSDGRTVTEVGSVGCYRVEPKIEE